MEVDFMAVLDCTGVPNKVVVALHQLAQIVM